MNFYRQVWTNKSNGQKLISIPSKENIKDGDWVRVSKADPSPVSDFPKPITKRKSRRKNK